MIPMLLLQNKNFKKWPKEMKQQYPSHIGKTVTSFFSFFFFSFSLPIPYTVYLGYEFPSHNWIIVVAFHL